MVNSPACNNEWVRGVCEKPRVKCNERPNQIFLPVSDQVVLDHLQGRHAIGVYPLLKDETCWFLTADFGKESRLNDVAAFVDTCRHLGVAAAKTRDIHPLLIIAVFSVVFLEIHPFQDGNGRLTRVLTTLLLLRSGYAYVSYRSLESVIEHSKEGYYLALGNTQGTIRSDAPEWHPWILYFLRTLQKQKQCLEARIEREYMLVAKLPEMSVHILELATEHGRLTVSQIVEITDANRNTVKKHLQSLVANRHLSQQGKGKGTWYGRA